MAGGGTIREYWLLLGKGLRRKKLAHGRAGGTSQLYLELPRGSDDSSGLTLLKVSLVELTMQQDDALNVLLTGRSESGFGQLLKRMVASRNLEFDMICLKPEVGPNNQRFPSIFLRSYTGPLAAAKTLSIRYIAIQASLPRGSHHDL